MQKPRSEDCTRNLFYGVQAMGIKFPQQHRCLFVLWAVFFNASVTFYLSFGFLMSWIVDIKNFGPSEFLTSLQVGMNAIGGSVKFVFFAALQYRFRDAATSMRQLDERCTRPEESAMIRRSIKFGNNIFNFFISMYGLYAMITFITQYAKGIPPYSIYLPVMDWPNSMWEFRIQAIIEYFLMNGGCFLDVVIDVYPVIYADIIRTHFRILAARVRRLGDDFDGLDGEERVRELVRCIVDHKHLMQLFHSVGQVMSVTLFLQFLLSGLVTGAAIINVLIFGNIAAILATCCFLFAVMLQTFPICYYGNCLLLDNEDLANAVFHSRWQDEDVRYKKMLVFFMQNVQKPPLFTAMKIFAITVDSNLKILKFAFSIYTLIQQMDIGKSYRKNNL